MVGPPCFMESMWRDLPSDILVNVLTFLPIASLCRFRTVSKEWNRLISDPDFASRHARASSPEEYVLMTLRYDNSFDSEGGWEVLDVANKRSFRLSDDFVHEYVLKEHSVEDLPNHYISDERGILAADGGLFCVAYFNGGDCEILLVCNPVLRTVKEIPTFSRLFYNQSTAVMSTDRASMEYEIFVINHAIEGDFVDEDLPNAFHIYESKTGELREVSIAPQRLCCLFEERNCCPVSTFVKNELYRVIFKVSDSSDNAIVSFDKVTGVISDLDIDIPCDGDELQLVVSEERLFCVTISEEPPSIEIFEIIRARKECIRLTEMPGEVLDWLRSGCEDLDWLRKGLLNSTIASTGVRTLSLFTSAEAGLWHTVCQPTHGINSLKVEIWETAVIIVVGMSRSFMQAAIVLVFVLVSYVNDQGFINSGEVFNTSIFKWSCPCLPGSVLPQY